MFSLPAFSHVCEELLPGGAHLADQGLVAGFLMSRGPEHHFCKHGRKIDSFDRQHIDHFSTIGRIPLGGDNSVGFEAAKPVRQNIGGDFL